MRNSTKLLTAATAILLAVPFTSALAQRRRGLVDVSPSSDRHGFWLNLGIAAGGENYRYENAAGCNGKVGSYHYCDALYKPSVSLALGGTVNPNLRLGGEINGWFYEHNDPDLGHVTSYLAAALLTGQFYPARNLGLFAKGGIGISRSGEDFSYANGTGETGFSYLVGVGYEIRLARNFFLTPGVNFMQHVSTIDPINDPDHLGTFHERVFTIGVGLTFQPGR